jgi:hypothetical protein
MFICLCLYVYVLWKFMLASMRILTNFKNPFSNPLKRPYSSDLTLRMLAGSRL